jgi:hypothetical protein
MEDLEDYSHDECDSILDEKAHSNKVDKFKGVFSTMQARIQSLNQANQTAQVARLQSDPTDEIMDRVM